MHHLPRHSPTQFPMTQKRVSRRSSLFPRFTHQSDRFNRSVVCWVWLVVCYVVVSSLVRCVDSPSRSFAPSSSRTFVHSLPAPSVPCLSSLVRSAARSRHPWVRLSLVVSFRPTVRPVPPLPPTSPVAPSDVRPACCTSFKQVIFQRLTIHHQIRVTYIQVLVVRLIIRLSHYLWLDNCVGCPGHGRRRKWRKQKKVTGHVHVETITPDNYSQYSPVLTT